MPSACCVFASTNVEYSRIRANRVEMQSEKIWSGLIIVCAVLYGAPNVPLPLPSDMGVWLEAIVFGYPSSFQDFWLAAQHSSNLLESLEASISIVSSHRCGCIVLVRG